jgi:class I fructose-bisphosphate aldolase
VENEFDPEAVRHAARLGAELGADIVKVSYTGAMKSFEKVVEGCHVPVIIAGGPKMESDREILEMVKGAMEAGAAGISIGRNVFQHKTPGTMVTALAGLVHENLSVDAAMETLENSGGKLQ